MIPTASPEPGMALPHTSHSLLERARDPGDADAWNRLAEVYVPLIRRWLRPYMLQAADGDDLVQEVLTTLAHELPRFQVRDQPGSFRAWLRTTTVHRLRTYWQTRRTRPRASGGSEFLDQLDDPNSDLSRAWDDEHDRHVARSLLDSIRLEFTLPTWQAFEATVRDRRPAAEVAAEMGLSVNAVLLAKSRVLRRLRQKAEGLLE
jgi:RNA polymerase sigma-70 factor (ECF subfamily)